MNLSGPVNLFGKCDWTERNVSQRHRSLPVDDDSACCTKQQPKDCEHQQHLHHRLSPSPATPQIVTHPQGNVPIARPCALRAHVIRHGIACEQCREEDRFEVGHILIRSVPHCAQHAPGVLASLTPAEWNAMRAENFRIHSSDFDPHREGRTRSPESQKRRAALLSDKNQNKEARSC